MTISVGGVTTQAGISQVVDPVGQNIRNQIANAQKQLQELSSNKELSMEEKVKKRQEIQQQISELNNQLRLYQMEQRRAKQQKQDSFDDMLGGNQKAGTAKIEQQATGLSQASMEAMISADTSMKQAHIQGSVATRMEGRANVIKAEIMQGGNTEAKKEELAEIEQKANNATASQMNTLAEVNKAVEEASKVDKTGGNEKESEEKNKTEGGEEISETAISEDSMGTGNVAANSQSLAQYTSVDIRL